MYKQLTKLPYIVCYFCAFVLGMKQLRNPDTWWQLLSGRWMLEQGEILRNDVFAYTETLPNWVNTTWLYQVVIAILEKGPGPHGVMLLQSLVNVALIFILLRLLQQFALQLGAKISTLFSTIAALLFLAVSDLRMAGTPEMMGHLFTAIFLLLLWHRGEYNWKKIGWLILLQCLWANMHESFVLGILIVAMYTIGSVIANNKDNTKKLGIVLAAMVVATMLNPFTVSIWQPGLAYLLPASVNKFDNTVFACTDAHYWTLQAGVHIALIVLTGIYWGYRFWQNKAEKRTLVLTPLLVGYLLTLPIVIYLSLSRNANIPFAQIVLFPTLPLVFIEFVTLFKLNQKEVYIRLAKSTTLISAALAVFFYIAVVSNSFYTATGSPNQYGLHINPLHNPDGAARFIRDNKVMGPGFADHTVSPYLLWSLYPEYKSYIDSRGADVFTPKFIENYEGFNTETSNFYDQDSLYKFNYVVLQNNRLEALRLKLYWGDGFNVVYIDPACMVLVRHVKENEELNYSQAASRLFTWPQAPASPSWAEALNSMFNPKITYEDEDATQAALYAGKFYNAVNNPRISLKLLQPAVQRDFSDNAEAQALLGKAYVMHGDYFSETKEERKSKWDSGRIFYQRALDIDDKCFEAHSGMATLALVNSDFTEAKKHLDFCISTHPDDYFIYFMHGFTARNLWKANGEDKYIAEVISSMNMALELDKEEEKAHLYLAEAYHAKGDKEKAKEEMKKLTISEMALSLYEKEMLKTLKEQTGVQPMLKAKDLLPDMHDHDHNHDHDHAH